MNSYEPRSYWTKIANEIAQRSGSSVVGGDDTPFYRYQRGTFVRKFLRPIPVEGKTVLEVGCGPGGNLLEVMRERPRKLVGCDISRSMIDLAIRNTGKILGIEYVEVDGRSLPFGERQFEITFTVTVLQHNLDPMFGILLREICRVTDKILYLFESTSHRKHQSYSVVTRPVTDYVNLCAAHGFELLEEGLLNVGVSQRVCSILMGRFNPPGRREGQPITRLNVLLEHGVLPITKVLDKIMPQGEGLTKMVFRRRLRPFSEGLTESISAS